MDDSTKDWFEAVVQGGELVSLVDFQSGPGLFGEVGHARFKFCLVTLGHGVMTTDLVFFARSSMDAKDPDRCVRLAPGEFQMLNPNTRTCPAFRSPRDALLTRRIYERHPILCRDVPEINEWGLSIRRYLDMNKSETLAECRPSRDDTHDLRVFEAKLIHQFNYRFGDYRQKQAGACPALC